MSFCCALSSGVQATFDEWTTAESQKDCSMVNLHQNSAHLAGQKKQYKDSLKESLKRCDIPYSTWEASAKDRPAWSSLVRAGVLAFEDNRISEKDQIVREERKGVQIPNLVHPPASPARIATDTSTRRLGSSAISAPTPPPSDSWSWSSSPAKDEHQSYI